MSDVPPAEGEAANHWAFSVKESDREVIDLDLLAASASTQPLPPVGDRHSWASSDVLLAPELGGDNDRPAGSMSAPPVREPAAVRRQRRDHLRARLIGCTILVLGALMAALLLDGPIGRLWVSQRQHHLAADYAAHRKDVRSGQALAVLQAPGIGLDVVVAEGRRTDDLRAGPVHAIGTPRPGDVGNSVIFGRARRWGGVFGRLGRLKPGDLLLTQVKGASPILFKVTDVHRAGSRDQAVLAPSDDRRLTLVTGVGGMLSNTRLVVVAVSGTAGHAQASIANASGPRLADAPWAPSLGWAALALASLGLLGWLSRSYGATARLAVLVPIAALAATCLYLEADLLLPVLH